MNQLDARELQLEAENSQFLVNKHVKRFSADAKPSDEFQLGLINYIPGCPHGLEYLFHTDQIYIKPYSGPHVVGHFSNSNKFEVLNCEGKRIFMINNNFTSKSELRLSNDFPEIKKPYPVCMSVLNYMEEEIYQYYGIPGKVLKVGPRDAHCWGVVLKRKNKSSFSFKEEKLRFDIILEGADNLEKRHSYEKTRTYVIDGIRKKSLCPTQSTKKLYYGTFKCGIFEADKWNEESVGKIESVGRLDSCLVCKRFQYTFPGVEFRDPELDVFHKAVILGALLIDVISY